LVFVTDFACSLAFSLAVILGGKILSAVSDAVKSVIGTKAVT